METIALNEKSFLVRLTKACYCFLRPGDRKGEEIEGIFRRKNTTCTIWQHLIGAMIGAALRVSLVLVAMLVVGAALYGMYANSDESLHALFVIFVGVIIAAVIGVLVFFLFVVLEEWKKQKIAYANENPDFAKLLTYSSYEMDKVETKPGSLVKIWANLKMKVCSPVEYKAEDDGETE